MGYVGKHRPSAPDPQPWEKAIGVGQDYGKPTGTGFTQGVARLALSGHEQQPPAIDPLYKGFKASFQELFPEVKHLAQKTQNLVGRLAVWRTGRQAAEQHAMHQAHEALRQVETEIIMNQALPQPAGQPLHESTPVDELVTQAGKASIDALTAPTLYLPRHVKASEPQPHSEHERQDSGDLVGSTH